MFDSISIGSFTNKKSFFRKIHPFLKIFMTFVFSLYVGYARTLLEQVVCLGGMIVFLFLSKQEIKTLVKILKYTFVFIVCLAFCVIFFRMSKYELIVNILKLLNIAFMSQVLLSTTTLQEMESGLTTFLYPLKWIKINPYKIAFSLTLAIHFLPVVFQKADIILKSLASRGMDYQQVSLFQKVKLWKMIFVPLFLSSIRSSDQLADTLEIRNFDLEVVPPLDLSEWKWHDSVLFIMLLYGCLWLVIRGVVK